jgi:MFS family permease
MLAPRHTGRLGLVVLAVGMLGLVLAAPTHSLAVLVAGSLLAGAGHGGSFLDAQQDLNELAPAERRGEVTSAFIAAIYLLVASAVVGTGLLDLRFSLQTSVAAVASALVVLALAVSGATPRASVRRRETTEGETCSRFSAASRRRRPSRFWPRPPAGRAMLQRGSRSGTRSS